ncbi:unnamed protein product, partial [Ectocarpus fasciculatus]
MEVTANTTKRVVVIGAGASGLGAARWLVDNDSSNLLDVHVVEARGRAGGRVHTASEEAGSENADALGLFDMGASWLHDPGPTNPISVMADTLKAPLLITDFDDDIAYDLKGNKHSDRQATAEYVAFEKALFRTAVKARKSQATDLSLEEAVKKNLGGCQWTRPLTQLYAAGMDFELGAPLYKCSSTECIDAEWLAAKREGDCDEEHDPIFPTTGFARIPITFNAPVVSIEQRIGDGTGGDATRKCTVTAMKKFEGSDVPVAWEADAVICTVPIGVLKAGSIEFIPELSSDKRHAVEATGVGNVVKVVMEFPTVFWDTHVTFMGIADAELCSDSTSPAVANEGTQQRGLCTLFLNGHKTCKKKILVTYATGDGADMVDRMTDEQLLSLCMSRVNCLARPGQRVPQPTRFVRSRWADDPYAMGAYSYWAKGNRPGLREYLKRPEGVVWFAGEAMHETSLLSSSVCGAWMSGVSAA